jgi:dTMP kinase
MVFTRNRKGNSASQGLFITFEGSEGCGKSTQVRRLAAWLRKNGLTVLLLREPGGTAMGERIRHLLKFSKSAGAMSSEAELFLFLASRSQLVLEKIIPALKSGTVVLCDRFADSTLVYQGFARGLDLKLIRKLNQVATHAIQPDLTIVLDQPVVTGLRRARKKTRTPDRMEHQKRQFYEAVRRGFRALSKSEPGRVKMVDATPSVDEVAERIVQLVKALPRIRSVIPLKSI